MSADSDRYEKDVAKNINKIPGVIADRPAVGVDFSDVLIKFKKKEAWLEVKMNHKDNLSNPRVFYKNGKWQTTYKTPAAADAVKILNESNKAKKFIKDIAKFTGIPIKSISIPTSKTGLREEGAVPLRSMHEFFDQPGINRYIANEENMDLGKIVTKHYLEGKTKPAFYMQAGDDFYLISSTNPLGLPRDIPILKGKGTFKVRVSTRTDFYEVQAEIKIDQMPNSNYSLKPGTKKDNPFLR